MTPTIETNEYLEYVFNGMSHKIIKTDPPSFVITFDYSNSEHSDKPQTWIEMKNFFDAL